MRPGETITPVTILPTRLPVGSVAGACLATDQRGDAEDIYYFIPVSATAAQFWRWNSGPQVWQRLADPGTFGGTARFGAGCSLKVDASGPTPLGGGTANCWLFHPDSVAPFAEFQFYNATLNTWTNGSQAGGAFNAGGLGAAALAAQWANDAAIAHPCTTVNPVTPSDDFIYVFGNAATFTYRYTISTGTVAAMAVRGGATAVGTTATWLPLLPDRIYSVRGHATGSAIIDWYGIVGNAWTNNMAYEPNEELWTAGVDAWSDPLLPNIFLRLAGRVAEFDARDATVLPSVPTSGAEGTPHVGSLMVSLRHGGRTYIYSAKHTSTEFQRALIVE